MLADPDSVEMQLVRRMARREAAMLVDCPRFAAWVRVPPTRVAVRTVPCPWCPRERQVRATHAGFAGIAGLRALTELETRPAGVIELTALPCEWLTARSLLVLIRGAEEGAVDVPPQVMTRSVAVAGILEQGAGSSWKAVLSALEQRESWADRAIVRSAAAGPTTEPSTAPVLPASSRLSPEVRTASAGAATLDCSALLPHMLTPHLASGAGAVLNTEYLRTRLELVAAAIAGH